MKPATPLPWHTRGPIRGLRLFIEAPKVEGMPYALDVCGEDYTGYGDEDAREQNMRYIVHACNAYPRLVEALRALTVAHGTPNEMLTAHTQAVKDGKRLLAELGE